MAKDPEPITVRKDIKLAEMQRRMERDRAAGISFNKRTRV